MERNRLIELSDNFNDILMDYSDMQDGGVFLLPDLDAFGTGDLIRLYDILNEILEERIDD